MNEIFSAFATLTAKVRFEWVFIMILMPRNRGFIAAT